MQKPEQTESWLPLNYFPAGMLDFEVPVFGHVEIGANAGAGPEHFEPDVDSLTEGMGLTAASTNGTFSIFHRLP